MAVFTFLEHYDFTGKTIKPFCTHEGSGLGSSVADIQRLCPTAVVESGIAILGGTAERAMKEIQKWIFERILSGEYMVYVRAHYAVLGLLRLAALAARESLPLSCSGCRAYGKNQKDLWRKMEWRK